MRAYKIFVGRPRPIWEGNIKQILKKWHGKEWTAEDGSVLGSIIFRESLLRS
jgi:hypothetical protein